MDAEQIEEGKRLKMIGWKRATPEVVLYDGDQLLVAVPVVSRFDPKKTHYEYSVIRASCDSETPVSFELTNGDDWGWDWNDVEWYISLSEFRLPTICQATQFDEIIVLARKHAHPGCNPGAHGLASEILRIVGERPENERSE